MCNGLMKWASCAKAVGGETECGDKCVVTDLSDGVLIAVIDGVGHGGKAALAAERAATIIEANKGSNSDAIIRRCHNELLSTRGAVLSLAVVKNEGVMHWVGVGNVEGRLIRREDRQTASEYGSLLLRTGTIGRGSLPALVPLTLPLQRLDTLVLVTDGIESNFEDVILPEQEPAVIADSIMSTYGKADDDALVFVGRYFG